MLSEMFYKLWAKGLIQLGIWETLYMTLLSSLTRAGMPTYPPARASSNTEFVSLSFRNSLRFRMLAVTLTKSYVTALASSADLQATQSGHKSLPKIFNILTSLSFAAAVQKKLAEMVCGSTEMCRRKLSLQDP